jgi:hypothetical protein
MKKHPKILLALDGSDRSFAASSYLGKMLLKQAKIVLFHFSVRINHAKQVM